MEGTASATVTTPAAAAAAPPGRDRPFVSITTDFGELATGICAAVVTAIVPSARVVVLTSAVRPFDIRGGALALWYALPYTPVGAHVAIVDPGVGTDRLPIALETARGDVLVGPDNGLLLLGAERLGGVRRAHALEDERYRLPSVSRTFHGRDVFSPAAAHLAAGVPIGDLGRALDPGGLVRPAIEPAAVGDGALEASLVWIDGFGNGFLWAGRDELAAALGAPAPRDRLLVSWTADGATRRVELPLVETFGEVAPGEPLLHVDHDGRLNLAVNQGSAARRLGLVEDARVRIARA